MKELCYFCKLKFNTDDLIDARGELVCEDCASEHCSVCSYGECEIETARGDCICTDCYSGMIDDAYETMRDCYE